MAEPLIIRNLDVRADGVALLECVSLRLEPGEFIALLGPNGAGKTTLLRAALALIPAAAGHVRIGERAVSSLSGRERAASLAWLPQQPRVAEPISALELVVAARYRFHESASASRLAALAALEKAGATAFAARQTDGLSGGEGQRVAVAALLAQEAPLLLLDEPANHLDPAQQIDLYRRIGDLWRSGLGILCITHDINLLSHAAGDRPERLRVVGIREGRLEFDLRLNAPELGRRLSALFSVTFEEVLAGGRRSFIPSTGMDEARA